MYHYQESGLRNVWLRNGFKKTKTPYGDAVAIEDVAGLHKALALRLAMKASKLSGTEIRFLRKEMEMSQATLSHVLSVNVQTLAKWEKGQAKIAAPADKLLRLVVKGHYSGNLAVRKAIEALNNLDMEVHESKLVFEEFDKKWRAYA